MVEAVKQNFPQREIAEASWRYQTEVEDGRRLIVGVNTLRAGRRAAARDPADRPRPGAQADRAPAGDSRAAGLGRGRERADRSGRGRRRPGRNLMPLLIDCARALCSEGEMIETMQRVFGSYRETPVF